MLTSTDPSTWSSLFLHGRQVPRLLHHHHRLLTRTNRRSLRRLLSGAMPAHWWQGKADRGLLIQEEVEGSRWMTVEFALEMLTTWHDMEHGGSG